MKFYACSNRRVRRRLKNEPVIRIGQETKFAPALQDYVQPSADEQHDDIPREGPEEHGGREDKVDGILRPPVERPEMSPPFGPQELEDSQLRGACPPVTEPVVELEGGGISNSFHRNYKKKKRFRTPPHPSDKVLLTTEEAAFVLDLDPDSLPVFRSTGRHGIPYIKIGRNVRYRRSDLEAWLRSHTHASGVTSKKSCAEDI